VRRSSNGWFRATTSFEPVDRVPIWEFGYWAGAVRRWYKEGLPKKVGIPDDMVDGAIARGPGLWWDEEKPPEVDIHNYFYLDPGMRHLPLNNFFCPKLVFLLSGETGYYSKESGLFYHPS